MLDYVVAYTVLGLGKTFSAFIKNKTAKLITGTFVVVFLRFVCHFLSGILIWNVYAPEGQSAFLYSLIYNGSYMGIELIIDDSAIDFIVDKIRFEFENGKIIKATAANTTTPPAAPNNNPRILPDSHSSKTGCCPLPSDHP